MDLEYGKNIDPDKLEELRRQIISPSQSLPIDTNPWLTNEFAASSIPTKAETSPEGHGEQSSTGVKNVFFETQNDLVNIISVGSDSSLPRTSLPNTYDVDPWTGLPRNTEIVPLPKPDPNIREADSWKTQWMPNPTTPQKEQEEEMIREETYFHDHDEVTVQIANEIKLFSHLNYIVKSKVLCNLLEIRHIRNSAVF
jgi:hypothetical protein